jgi:putative transcriptional regulator
MEEVLKNPYELTPEQRARLDALTEEDIEAAALADPDAQPMTDAQLEAASIARRIRRLRERLDLSQAQFATRFNIPPATIRDWEQGRRAPNATVRAYLKVIERETEAVDRALAG